MKYLHCLAIILWGFLLTRVYGAEVTHVMKEIPFEDVTLGGLPKVRAELAFRHLQEEYFQWGIISRVNFDPFPGDAIGRAINGLTLLSRALHQQAPANLQKIRRRVPELAGSGYYGDAAFCGGPQRSPKKISAPPTPTRRLSWIARLALAIKTVWCCRPCSEKGLERVGKPALRWPFSEQIVDKAVGEATLRSQA